MNWRVLWLLIRPARIGASTLVLPVVAFAVITTVALSVAAIAGRFWFAPDNEFGAYRLLGAGLVILLFVPLSTLAGAAARLSARRRDDRLATLRLLGATSALVRRIAFFEAVVVAAIGAVVGVLLYLLAAPLLLLVPVQGEAAQVAEMWLPWWVTASLAAGVVAIAALSATASLRMVVMSPLGVRTRSDAPRMRWVRLLIGGGVIALALVLSQSVSGSWGATGIAAAYAVALVAVMSVLGVVGPFLTARFAGLRAKRASTASALIAARVVLESPVTAWRQVSGVALASFLVVPAGSMLGYLDMIQRTSPVVTDETRVLFADIRTVLLVALVISFLLVACSVGVTQAAAVLERGAFYVSLDRLGMPRHEMNRSRWGAVLLPLLVASLGSALASTALVFLLVAIAVATAPLFVVAVVLLLAAGIGAVRVAVAATTPVLRSVLARPDRVL